MPTEQEKRWITAWRLAGPEMERIRNEELRSLDESEGFRLLGANPRPTSEGMNGMAIQQAWFMRMRVKQLMRDALADDT